MGCASGPAIPDELAGTSVDEAALDDPAGAINGAYTYFSVTADARRCPSPMCGGWFIQRLNRQTTRCHDGRVADTCYTPVFDWSEANLPEDLQSALLAAAWSATDGGVYAIVRGRFEPTNTTPLPNTGRFVVTEAWTAEKDTPADGVFVRVFDNGLRCFAPPCPSITEKTLNMGRVAEIAGMDFAPSGLGEDEIAECMQAMTLPGGMLVAGYRYTWYENATSAKGRTVTAAYHRLGVTVP
ncbi:MAG TPA: DUF6748 domain-containing protein [Kofleriaceae bacterium]|nr:DUF6748 domain-containing protein [Kofleriaceae bacterium]